MATLPKWLQEHNRILAAAWTETTKVEVKLTDPRVTVLEVVARLHRLRLECEAVGLLLDQTGSYDAPANMAEWCQATAAKLQKPKD